LYPVVFVDALRVKIRDEGTVRSKAGYLALGVLADGTRDILGVWIEQTEGAKFWMKVFTALKTRGCHDILIAVTDGLKGMSEAIEAVYPATTRQTCLVHLMRQSLDLASGKSASRWRRRCGRSTRRHRRTPRPRPSRPSRRATGAVAFRRSARRGDARGHP
jgi:transposase-like protein